MSKKQLKLLLESNLATSSDFTIDSYLELVRDLSDSTSHEPELFFDRLGADNYTEDVETTYKSFPIGIYFRQLPIIKDSDFLVKVVILRQADNYAIVMPEDVKAKYKQVKESPETIDEVNKNYSLFSGFYGLDAKDQELLDLIKTAYIESGGELAPFEIVGELKQEYDKIVSEETVESEDDFSRPTADLGGSSETTGDDLFGDIDNTQTSLEETPGIEENLKALKKFNCNGDSLQRLLEKLYKISNGTIKHYTKKSYLNENKNVLVLEVDNKEIFKRYKHIPTVAKKLLSNFGEAIRKNKDTQLVDAFTDDRGKKYFIIAENLSNNYWYVKKEKIEEASENSMVIEPLAKNIIKLNKSSIRPESRAYRPVTVDKKVIFQKNF
jgi:hypothetical protein